MQLQISYSVCAENYDFDNVGSMASMFISISG